MTESIKVYWPDVAKTFAGLISNPEIDPWDESIELPTVAQLPVRYGDGRTYVCDVGGYFYLVIAGNEYGSSAWGISQFLAKCLKEAADNE